VVFFKRLAEIVGEYLKKGSKIYIEGSIRTRKWTDKSGNDRYTTEIIGNEMQMLDRKDASTAARPAAAPTAAKPAAATNNNTESFDDDIPF